MENKFEKGKIYDVENCRYFPIKYVSVIVMYKCRIFKFVIRFSTFVTRIPFKFIFCIYLNTRNRTFNEYLMSYCYHFNNEKLFQL